MGIHPLTLSLFVVLAALGGLVGVRLGNPLLTLVGAIVGLGVVLSVRIARPWQRALVLRLGKFRGLKGPGLFGIFPFTDTVPYWIDMRVITTPFTAEQTLTKDSVPVDVDAALFWRTGDPMKAAPEV